MTNNYGLQAATSTTGGSMMEAVAKNREIAQVQGQVFMAKQFPRDEVAAINRIKAACKRPSLANAATYSYPRGGQTVTGPSIRLAEVIIQNWGNADFGFKELQRIQGDKQTPGKSVVEAYAWDLETNTRRTTHFEVFHVRDTKQGPKVLTEERDIYETIANQASRRMRGCILQLIPGDIVDEALETCNDTLRNEITDPAKLKATIARVIKGFASMEVPESMLVKYLGDKRSTQWTKDDLEKLLKIAAAIKEGYSTPADYFEAARNTQKISESQRAELMHLAKPDHKAAIAAIKPLGFDAINSVTVAAYEQAKELIVIAVSKKDAPVIKKAAKDEPFEVSTDDDILNAAMDGVK